ncbi:tetratricopeptide repeat protein [Desulfolutivibrio sulfoxidireducens]|uniref:tetratricopeptide repeat protein n=1 Tax=Desulfolutivibrio sulfoxidireducens TaxID=2773299 RepID=UPI00159D8A01|nr:tetratricopeptide repeat protein [Desulfolutivibrio sulfoxidireducens]QLA16110.1 tetratricopeptide repeat protein [Desulfolutivibrio sulfoxidireducens]
MRMLLACILAVGLGLNWASTCAAQAGADADVGYSSGTRRIEEKRPAAPESSGETPATREEAARPRLSIILEGYEKAAPGDRGQATAAEPTPKPVPETAAEPTSKPVPETVVEPTPKPVPEPAVSSPAIPAVPTPSPGAVVNQAPVKPGRKPAQQSPAPAPAMSRPAVPGRPSPVLAMIESTLRGNFGNTRAIERNMSPKFFHASVDKAAGAKQSALGNDLLNKKDKPAEALAAYESAYAHDPSSSEITGSYGYALFRNGRFEAARDMELESLEISPGYAAAWFVLGQIYGFLKQEDMAYASFVNTCIFTKNIKTSLGFLDRERVRSADVCVQRAAGRALDVCRRMGGVEEGAGVVSPVPASPEPGAVETSPPATGGRKIGKIDIMAVVFASKNFQGIMAKMVDVPKPQRDKRLEELLSPLLNEVREALRGYAERNGYQAVILAEKENSLRQAGVVSERELALVDVSDEFLAFLNSNAGRHFRKTAPIDDLTPAIVALVQKR